ncbi:hypothetical protein ACOMHN_048346 [Nucella lapillus]
MADSEDELKSPSRTSIQVKLPSAAQRSAGSRSHGTPDSRVSTKLKGSDYAPSFPAPTPTSPHSGSPVRSIRHGVINQKELELQAAASVIERAWIAFRDKQMFRLLKHSVCAAENSLTLEILRKVCPKEADFFRDKSLQIRVRFRFGGEEYPPLIFFKIYTHTVGGKGIKYISGRKMIKPATEAAEDSLRLMGNRHFYDQMLQDTIRYQQAAIVDEVDVTTLKDYMQYLSNLDETPAYLGGRENYWRKLSLDDLPRHTIFYDVVDFAYNQRMTPRLKQEIPLLMSRPVTQEVQVRHIQAISKLRTPTMPYVPAPTPAKSKMSGARSQLSSRRSRQAKIRSMKMRRLYSNDLQGEDMIADLTPRDDMDYFDHYGITGEEGGEGELDQEASRLYEWTQSLNINDDLAMTPPTPAR